VDEDGGWSRPAGNSNNLNQAVPLRIRLRRRLLVGLVLAPAIVVACISSVNRGHPLSTAGARRWVSSPIKAHLMDGSVVLFRSGANVGAAGIVGNGKRFTPTLDSSSVDSIPLSDVVGVEAYERDVNTGRTLVYSTLVGAASAVATAALAIVIFGSCPTIYADSAGTQTLQAESFSYSIAPLLEKRDVDVLNVRADARGVVRLDVRNEALETHYIDQLELLEARHRGDEVVMPVAKGGLAAVRNVTTPSSMIDSRGRNVAAALASVDGVLLDSPTAARAASDTSIDTQDWIDITLPRTRGSGGDSVAVVMSLRSSLLSTTIFYDHMLARHGARSLDWVGRDLRRITTVAQVAKWYADRFGLRVSVRDGNEWRQVARLIDFGPAAWRTVAAMVPDVGDDSLRIRLSFVADEFRIDRVGISREIREIKPRTLRAARVTGSGGEARDDVRDFIRDADEHRLITVPGDRFFAEFDAGPNPAAGDARTFLVAATGYYVEWVRPAWIARATDTLPFSTRTTTREVLHTWIESRDSLEQHFFVDKAAVR
jgi:hypothetical protein